MAGTVENLVQTIRRDFADDDLTTLFIHYRVGTDLVEQPDGPPLYRPEGVPAGSYRFRPLGIILSSSEYEELVERLQRFPEGSLEEPPQEPPSDRALTREEITRNRLRAKAHGGDRVRYK